MFQVVYAKKRIAEGYVCARKDEKPATRLAYTLGKRQLVPLLLFPSGQL